jgi:mevalonate kinase
VHACVAADLLVRPLPSLLAQCQALCEAAVPAADPSDQVNALRRASEVLVYLVCAMAVAYDRVDDATGACHVTVTSELPIGAGLGSSASFSVAVSAALLARLGVVAGSAEQALSEGERSMVNAWAYVGESILHGNPSGLDNTMCVLGGALAYRKGEAPKPAAIHALRFLLVNTKQGRSTKELVAGVGSRLQRFPAVVQVRSVRELASVPCALRATHRCACVRARVFSRCWTRWRRSATRRSRRCRRTF